MTYDEQANAFLSKHNIIIQLKKGGNKKPCSWECGDSYSVKIKGNGKTMIFDFHDSIHNQREGLSPSSYEILSTIAAESYCPDNVDDFAADYGITKPSEAIRLFKFCKAFSTKIQKFFTENQLEELLEIQ
jgi:hypothetical protein